MVRIDNSFGNGLKCKTYVVHENYFGRQLEVFDLIIQSIWELSNL